MPDPSPSTLTVLNSNFLQLGRRSGFYNIRTLSVIPLLVTSKVTVTVSQFAKLVSLETTVDSKVCLCRHTTVVN